MQFFNIWPYFVFSIISICYTCITYHLSKSYNNNLSRITTQTYFNYFRQFLEPSTTESVCSRKQQKVSRGPVRVWTCYSWLKTKRTEHPHVLLMVRCHTFALGGQFTQRPKVYVFLCVRICTYSHLVSLSIKPITVVVLQFLKH